SYGCPSRLWARDLWRLVGSSWRLALFWNSRQPFTVLFGNEEFAHIRDGTLLTSTIEILLMISKDKDTVTSATITAFQKFASDGARHDPNHDSCPSGKWAFAACRKPG